MASQNQDRIDASVSKEFFVEMLVKDISLPMAIHDLIDNCIDGALRLRGNKRFDGLKVDLQLSHKEFSIIDNCGGIDLEIARDYAFRFGRPKDAPSLSHSIGRFGVGMKRAIFKLGQSFTLSSTSAKNGFRIEVDVPTWAKSNDWKFEFDSKESFSRPAAEKKRGTTLRISNLFPSVAEQFSLEYFLNDLRSSIAVRCQDYLEKGLTITIKGKPVSAKPVQFLVSDQELLPAFREADYNGVHVREVAGVSKPLPAEAGWYIYCNGRMILHADQSELTGWGEAGIERVPKYHNSFAMFRGCVYFDSDDPTTLPWNTTKDGVDQESGIYRSVRTEMVTLMKPVMNFLRVLAKERDESDGSRPLTQLTESAQLLSVKQLAKSNTLNTFRYKKPQTKPQGPRTTKIQYDQSAELVEKVQKSLGVKTAKAAGERTFDYYVKTELEE